MAQCKLCGDIIESTHVYDFKFCKCGAIFVDGGKEYLRRGGKDLNLIIELSVKEGENNIITVGEHKCLIQ